MAKTLVEVFAKEEKKKARKNVTKATQRTQQRLKKLGYDVAHAERKLPATARGWRGPLITQDLFGFIDTMAVNAWEILAVQSCSGVDHQKRVRKIMASPVARRLAYFMSIEVWSWAKGLPEGKPRNKKTSLLIRRKVWKLRRENLTLRLLPKDSLLRAKLEQKTWDVGRRCPATIKHKSGELRPAETLQCEGHDGHEGSHYHLNLNWKGGKHGSRN
jgi:hypothetical protein